MESATVAFPDSATTAEVTTTIANYKRERPEVHQRGSIIAVDDDFTCYAIRNGLIRAIHRQTEATVLLRGLPDDVSDMCFRPPHIRSETHVLVAASRSGTASAWQLSLDVSGGTPSLEATVLLKAEVPGREAGFSACRVCFLGDDVVATMASGSREVQLWSLGDSSEGVAPIVTFEHHVGELSAKSAPMVGKYASGLALGGFHAQLGAGAIEQWALDEMSCEMRCVGYGVGLPDLNPRPLPAGALIRPTD